MNQTETDKRLREQISRNLPNAPENPWFTRTVLNRLPEKKRNIAARMEIIISLIGIAATLWFGGNYVADTLKQHEITVGDLVIYVIYLSIFAGLAANIGSVMWQRTVAQIRKGIARMQ